MVAAAVFLASSPVMANAEDSKSSKGWYAGLGMGSATYSADTIIDDSDMSFTVFGGYKFNQYLALQANVLNLGEYSGDGVVLNSTEISGLSMTVVGILPIGNQGFELFGRLGLGLINYEQNYDLWDYEGSNSSIGEALVSSVGVNYTPVNFKQMSFHLAYENYYFETRYEYEYSSAIPASNATYDSHSIGVFTLGARYNF